MIDSVPNVLNSMAEEFTRRGVRLNSFEKRYAEYWKRRHELESDPQAPGGVGAFLTKSAIQIGMHVARDVPLAGSILAPVDEALVAEQAEKARVYLLKKFNNYTERRLLFTPIEELTSAFIVDLNRIAANQPIAVFFDTYERTAPVLDRWLRHLYEGRYGALTPNLIVAISGQYPLSPNLWGAYLPIIADISLEYFSTTEARELLGTRSITDDRIVNAILTLSGGLPLWLSMLADNSPKDPADIGDPTGDVVEQFLKWEYDPIKRKTAIVAALPRILNNDILHTAVADQARSDDLFLWLCARPFVSKGGGGWVYHDVVRAAMLAFSVFNLLSIGGTTI